MAGYCREDILAHSSELALMLMENFDSWIKYCSKLGGYTLAKFKDLCKFTSRQVKIEFISLNRIMSCP